MTHTIRAIKNTLYLLIGVVLAFILANLELFNMFLTTVHRLDYLDAFIGGILLAFTFSFAVGGLIVVTASETINPYAVAAIAGLGCMISDIIIFRFIKDTIPLNAQHVCEGPKSGYFARLYCHRYFQWTLPVIGAIIIASPLPDELGVSLVGISNMSLRKFAVMACVIDTLGALVLIGAVRVIF